MVDDGQALPSFGREEERTHHLRAQVAHVTDIGRRRRNNQDNLLVLPIRADGAAQEVEPGLIDIEKGRLLVAVADGMGGHFGGEEASRLCVENLAKEIVSQLSSGQAALPAALLKAVEAAHKAVFAHAQNYREKLTMGTTLTAALLHGEGVELAQVGDSRAYLFREGNLILLTQDQTIGNQLRSRGEDTNKVDAQIQEMLTQAAGAQEAIDVAMTAVELEPRDLLLLCCDGLHKVVAPAEIADTLETDMTIQEKAAELVRLANEGGGPDNITVILTEITEADNTA